MADLSKAHAEVVMDEKGVNPIHAVETPSTFRFTRETSSNAPKPGHHLGDISYTYNGESVSVYAIEGGQNNALSFTGLATNFASTRLLSFSLAGNFRELLDCMPYSPHNNSQIFEYSDFVVKTDKGEHVEFPFTQAKVIYTRVRSGSGVDPDGGVIQLTDNRR